MHLIDSDALGTRLTPSVLVEALRTGHRSGGMGGVERMLLESGDDATLTWAGWRRDIGFAVKTATVFPGNAAAGRPNVQSTVTLFDGETGTPLALIHGDSFTRMKTAADSALAADILARSDAHTLAVLGAGAQAETHIRFLCAVRPTLRRIRIWNRTPAAAAELASRVASSGIAVTVADSAEAAVRGACVVSCLTAATRPILMGDWLTPGAHVDLVGGYTPEMRESDDATMLRSRLFADSLRFGVETCGDYAQPLRDRIIARDRIEGDLFGLCSGIVEGRRTADEITVCKNGGGGHLDLMVARAFHDLDPASIAKIPR